MADDVLAPGCSDRPYWWEGQDGGTGATLGTPPARADVAVIGSGFTGVSAALDLARAGRSVVILEAERAGHGCSTRNGGQISGRFHPSFEELAASHGADKARRLKREGLEAYDYLQHVIQSEALDCSFETNGNLLCAHKANKLAPAVHEAEQEERELGIEAHVVPKAELRDEVGSDAFHGGILFPQSGALDPMRYHRGLLDRALAAGAKLYEGQKVKGVQRDGQDFTVHLDGGKVIARDVVLATNGYTGTATPWWRRRLIPIGSYIIATEEIDPALMSRLCPRERTLNETRRVVYYYRQSPDKRRILFGGRVAIYETDTRASAPRLHAAMVRVFPELAKVKVTHSWMGFVAFTFDHLPHVGSQDGVHYAMGYCGNGVPRATYYGHKAAQKILGDAVGRSELDDLPFQTRPLYTGMPWFLAPSLAWYKLKDRLL